MELYRIFQGIDDNGDNYISPAELRVLIIGIKLEDDGFVRGDYADKVREAFDVDGDTNINEDEFVAGLSKFLLEAQQSVNKNVLQVPNTVSPSLHLYTNDTTLRAQVIKYMGITMHGMKKEGISSKSFN